MIACKHGRDENVKELLAIMDDQNINDVEDDHDEVIIKKPRVAINVKNRHTKAAIHYAAKHGHLVGTQVLFSGCTVCTLDGTTSTFVLLIKYQALKYSLTLNDILSSLHFDSFNWKSSA